MRNVAVFILIDFILLGVFYSMHVLYKLKLTYVYLT